jgi:HAE1 family hydrophobic/amphiphilic exporter-1
VPTADGGRTPLASVADLSFQAGPGKIDRFDRERQIAVQADLAPGTTLGEAMDAIDRLPVLAELPPGVRQPSYGDAEAMAELFGGFAAAMAAGIGMIFAVLVLLFGGFLEPLVILSALPLSVGGAFLSLALFGMPIELPVLIGLLMLMGLAAKNSILLVEFAIERERAGAPRREAILEACRERARPIIMTTFAMAAGMLPAALGIGEGYEIRQAMAVAVIGGLASSTALSLVLVPVVYELVAGVADRVRARLGRLASHDEAPREADQPPFPAAT